MKTINKEEIGNLDEFIKLIETYKSITLEFLKEKWFRNGFYTMENITGFGDINKCILCQSTILCFKCIYTVLLSKSSETLYNCINSNFYQKIYTAKSPETLYKTLQGRIKFMEKLLKQIK